MANLFDIERNGDILIVVPISNLGESSFHGEDIGASTVLAALDNPPARSLIMDFHKTEYFGSSALYFFVKLWKRICQRRGRMAFCNLAPHEKEVLEVTNLDDLWKLCGTRDEAMQFVQE